jgi:hypothetical protein
MQPPRRRISASRRARRRIHAIQEIGRSGSSPGDEGKETRAEITERFVVSESWIRYLL